MFLAAAFSYTYKHNMNSEPIRQDNVKNFQKFEISVSEFRPSEFVDRVKVCSAHPAVVVGSLKGEQLPSS